MTKANDASVVVTSQPKHAERERDRDQPTPAVLVVRSRRHVLGVIRIAVELVELPIGLVQAGIPIVVGHTVGRVQGRFALLPILASARFVVNVPRLPVGVVHLSLLPGS